MAAAGDSVASAFPAIFLILFFIMWLAIPLIGIAGTIFWIFMLIDCIKRDSLADNKIIWILVLVFTNMLGAIIYFFVIKHPASKLEKNSKQAVPPVQPSQPVV